MSDTDLNRIVGRVFGHTNEESIVAHMLHKDEDFAEALKEMDADALEYLEYTMKPLVDRCEIGKKQAKYVVELSRLLLAFRLNDEELKEDLSKFGSVRNAYDALKNRVEEKLLGGNNDNPSDQLNFKVTLESMGRTYMLVFEPNNTVLQDVALEKIKSCFSFGGIYRDYADAYMNSKNVFFVPIISMDKGSVVGRFTLAFGKRCEDAEDIREVVGRSDNDVLVRLSVLHLDETESGIIFNTDVDEIIEKYARRIGRTLAESGKVVIEVPERLHNIYDDYFQLGDSTHMGSSVVKGKIFERLDLESELFKAVKSRDMAEFLKIVARGIDPNQTDRNYIPLIFRVIERDEAEMLRVLLAEPGLRVDGRSENGNNIMHRMASYKNGGNMLAIFSKSNKFDARLLYERNNDNKTPIELSVDEPNSEFLRLALGIDSECADMAGLLETAESKLKVLEKLERNVFARAFREFVVHDDEDRGERIEGERIERFRAVIGVLENKLAETSRKMQGELVKA